MLGPFLCLIYIIVFCIFFPKKVTHVKIGSCCDFISKECKSLLTEEFSQNTLKNDEGKRIVIFSKYKHACKQSSPRVFREKESFIVFRGKSIQQKVLKKNLKNVV